MNTARHAKSMPLAVGAIRDRETAIIDLRDDDGPVAEIMAASADAEIAYDAWTTCPTKPMLDDWLAARLELRKVASRIVYGMDVDVPSEVSGE